MNPQEPAGGFQQGGWYEGRQYWDGSFSAPGVIHSASPQQGAGQAVSQETVQQTDPKNWEYIQQQRERAGVSGAGQQGAGQQQQPTGIDSIGAAEAPNIDLPGLYKSLTESSGISGLEAELSTKTTAYNDAMSKINDNPFLSEANRVGRGQKLTMDFNSRIAKLQNDIATKKADVETQLNLQTKQYDIESQEAQLALSRFNSLLSSGALDNISGQDIAGLTRSTGLSSSMIQSAVASSIKKNNPVSIQTYDDGTNQGFVAIDSQGNIVSKSIIAGSKPSGGLSTSQQRSTTADARQIIQEVDEQYRTTDKVATKLKYEADYSGDTYLSAAEYMKAVEALMKKTGLDEATAAEYVTQAMDDMGYKNWTPKQ